VRAPLSFVAAAVGYFWALPWAAGRRLGGASQGVTPWGMEHVGRPTVFLGGRSSTSSSANSSFCSDCQSGRPLLPPICVVGPPLLYVAVNFNLHSSHVSLSAVLSLLLFLMVVSDKPT